MTASGTWLAQLPATRAWLDRRDAGLCRSVTAPPLGPGIASLYLEFVARPRTGPVLDIGCGRGERSRHFAGGYVGIDALAAPNGTGLDGGPFPVIRARAEELPWRDASFDAVLSVEAFDHFADPATAAAEALRVLRPGGELLVFVRDGVADAPAEAAVHMHVFGQDSLTALFAGGLARWRVGADAGYLLLLGERR
jgi:SAM-dependent methyltransferase